MGPIMRRNSLIALMALVLAGASADAQQHSAKETTYRSPDGSLDAVVRSVNHSESEVRVQAASGEVLARRNYRSEDGEHGFGVARAQWTPDSQFFVFSLSSSGGHQPWHTPVQYYNRRNRKVVSLDDALSDAVMNPQFSIEAPDKVTVELYFSKKTRTVSLSSLTKTRVSGPTRN